MKTLKNIILPFLIGALLYVLADAFKPIDVYSSCIGIVILFITLLVDRWLSKHKLN